MVFFILNFSLNNFKIFHSLLPSSFELDRFYVILCDWFMIYWFLFS